MILKIPLETSKEINLQTLSGLLLPFCTSNAYTCKSFGIGQGKSLLIGKSFNVGVRVFIKENNIELHPSFGSPFAILLGVGAQFLLQMNLAEKGDLQKEVWEFLKEMLV